MLNLVTKSAISESETERYELEGAEKIKGKNMSKEWHKVYSSELIKKISCRFFCPSSAYYRKDLENHPVPMLLPWEGTPFTFHQVNQSPIRSGLEHFHGWSIHSFSEQPVLVPHYPWFEKWGCQYLICVYLTPKLSSKSPGSLTNLLPPLIC